jgi:hypothetical protein
MSTQLASGDPQLLTCKRPHHKVLHARDVVAGDHIVNLHKLFTHHLIVVGSSEEENVIQVAHFTGKFLPDMLHKMLKYDSHETEESGVKHHKYVLLNHDENHVWVDVFCIRSNSLISSNVRLHLAKVHFEPHERRPLEVSVNNALQQISKNFGVFSFMENNSEHFATFCVLGEKQSLQVQKFGKNCDVAKTVATFGVQNALASTASGSTSQALIKSAGVLSIFHGWRQTKKNLDYNTLK